MERPPPAEPVEFRVQKLELFSELLKLDAHTLQPPLVKRRRGHDRVHINLNGKFLSPKEDKSCQVKSEMNHRHPMQVRHIQRESINPTETTDGAFRFRRIWVGKSKEEGLTTILRPGDCKRSPPGHSNPTQLQQEPGDEL